MDTIKNNAGDGNHRNGNFMKDFTKNKFSILKRILKNGIHRIYMIVFKKESMNGTIIWQCQQNPQMTSNYQLRGKRDPGQIC